jgi:putative hydrolase of the HAD superfamily
MIRLVTFDLDDTLWACAPVIERTEQAMHGWFDRYYPRIPKAYSIETLRKKRMHLMECRADLRHDMTALRHASLIELAHEFGYPKILADGGVCHFLNHRSLVCLFEGALPLLERLRESYLLGAITNGNAELGRVGIERLFHVNVSSARAGVSKPNSRIFEYALLRSGVQPHEAVHVGDDAVNDVQGAAAAGMRTVWFNPAMVPWPGGQTPNAVIASLDTLDALLNR